MLVVRASAVARTGTLTKLGIESRIEGERYLVLLEMQGYTRLRPMKKHNSAALPSSAITTVGKDDRTIPGSNSR